MFVFPAGFHIAVDRLRYACTDPNCKAAAKEKAQERRQHGCAMTKARCLRQVRASGPVVSRLWLLQACLLLQRKLPALALEATQSDFLCGDGESRKKQETNTFIFLFASIEERTNSSFLQPVGFLFPLTNKTSRPSRTERIKLHFSCTSLGRILREKNRCWLPRNHASYSAVRLGVGTTSTFHP
jgi:hypothetical protein